MNSCNNQIRLANLEFCSYFDGSWNVILGVATISFKQFFVSECKISIKSTVFEVSI